MTQNITPQPIKEILVTKLHPPQVRFDLVARPRLYTRLDAWTRYDVTLISAPAGFGKTTLLSSWCSTLRPDTYAWLALDSSDNDPMRFWTYIITALRRFFSDQWEQRFSSIQSLIQSSSERLLTILINALTDLPHDIALILDDYHIITSPELHTAMTFLLDHMPARFHLILAGRGDPPLPLARLRARRCLNELRTADLRFTLAEVSAFLQQVMGLQLTPQQITTLDAHIEGWIAGLQLAALSMQGQADIARFLASFTGSNRYILPYLSEEVLQRQPEHVRDFLLHTAVLERLSAPLCDAITQRRDGQTILDYLEQANLFLIPLDEQRQWYRYHHLFAEFLRARLQRDRPELVPVLHLRAAQWYEQYGLINVTMEHALASGNMEYTAHLAERFALTMIARGEVTTFLRWLERLPAELLSQHLQLCITQAAFLETKGQLDAAERVLHEIERALPRLKQENGQALHLESDYLAAYAGLYAFRGDLPRTLEVAAQAEALLPADDINTRSILATIRGSAYVLHGDLLQASHIFDEAISLGNRAGNKLTALTSLGVQGYILACQGRLHRAAETYHKAMQQGTGEGGRFFAPTSLAYVQYSDLLYEWNRLEEAERYASDGLAMGQRWGHLSTLAQGYIVQARIQVVRGNYAQAQDLMQATYQQVQGYSYPTAQQQVVIWNALLALQMGREDMTLTYLSELQQSETLIHFRGMQQLLLAKLAMIQHQPDRALQIANELLQHAGATGEQRIVIDALALQATITHTQGQPQAAMRALAHALKLAEPEGYIRAFIDYGDAMIELLRYALAHEIASTTYIHKLLAACDSAHAAILQGNALSERELSVLHYLAAGRSNQEIARALVVATSTIKTHISNIYTKLGVHTRTQAIARARELGLL